MKTLELRDQLADGEALGTRPGNEFTRQLVEPALPLGIIAPHVLMADEGPGTLV
ncbi:MAG: hypothetical protein GY953_27060, partial [bacterium]|nr:hypothetical protein [bacterium]